MRKYKRRIKFKSIAMALIIILCNGLLINAVAEPLGIRNNDSIIKNNDEIKQSKTVSDPNEKGEYEITLKVSGTPKTKVTPVDIIMVMDTSGSMNKDITTLKTSMGAFVDKILGTVQDSNISVLEFFGPTSFNRRGSANDSIVVSDFDSSDRNIKRKINSVSVSGGTNAQAAWMKVKDQLRKSRDDAKKYVLFFTDGLPTVLVNEYPVDSKDLNKIENTLIPKTKTAYNNAILNTDIKTYSVGLIDNIRGEAAKNIARKFLGEINNSGVYYIEKGNTNFDDIYNEIANNIITDASMANEAILTDLVTDEFQIVSGGYGEGVTSQVIKPGIDGAKDEILDIKPTINGDKISWNLGNIGVEGRIIKFKIKLKNDYYGTGNEKIFTNKEAYMDYKDPITGEYGNVIFDKPLVAIPYKEGSITIEKVVKNNEGIEVPLNDTFSIALDGLNSDIGKINVNLKANEKKVMKFYLKDKDTDISNNKDILKNYINVGTYNIKEVIPMNYELEGIYVNGVEKPIGNFTINKDNKDITIRIVNKYVNDKYFYDKSEMNNEFKYNK